MNLTQHLHRLFAWDSWANREVLVALKTLADPPTKTVSLIAHIVAAEWLWLNRLRGEIQRLEVWPEFTVEQSESEYSSLPEQWTRYLDQAAHRLTDPVDYVNTKGEPWSSTIHDVLTHVVTHSAYHRGQIATDLRAAGHAPPYTDFIHATRRGLL